MYVSADSTNSDFHGLIFAIRKSQFWKSQNCDFLKGNCKIGKVAIWMQNDDVWPGSFQILGVATAQKPRNVLEVRSAPASLLPRSHTIPGDHYVQRRWEQGFRGQGEESEIFWKGAWAPDRRLCLPYGPTVWEGLLHSTREPKTKIWTSILEKVNTLGVTQRTIPEIRKCWYDLRSRTKEKVGSRMADGRGTGGEPSKHPPLTPIETFIEGTLEPESVVGVSDIDTSNTASTSQGKSSSLYLLSITYCLQIHISYTTAWITPLRCFLYPGNASWELQCT